MFGNSTNPTSASKEGDADSAAPEAARVTTGPGSIPDGVSFKPFNADDADDDETKTRGRSDSVKAGEDGEGKKRRSSGVAKSLLEKTKNSLHLPGSSHHSLAEPPSGPQKTALQKLGATDPALNVPQGSLNNSAGESRPGPRSTFRVGVTEDKNRKCRRTMEDTHAYLYNFLSTPAPALAPDSSSTSSHKSQKAKPPPGSDPNSSTGAHVVETDNGYFAIFDGHAGTFAADWCGKKLHVLLEEMIRRYPNTPVPELLDQTFTDVDQQLEKLPLKNSGCTAICAVLRWEDRTANPQSTTGSTAMAPAMAAVTHARPGAGPTSAPTSDAPDKASDKPPPESREIPPGLPDTVPKLKENASRQRVLYTANVGDARIVLCRAGKALRLSYDHKGSDENEGKRISNAGGLILNNRVNGVLAVTRALGDAYMKELVTGHPYTTETVIQPDIDEFLILACDGLWDVCTDQEAVDLIRSKPDAQTASKILVDHALARFSTDNLSCMVVRFDSRAVQETVERKVDPIGVDGDPPVTEGGISEADAIVKEARKSMPDVGKLEGPESEEQHSVSQEVIREEEEQETGPELDPDGISHIEGARERPAKPDRS